MPHATFQDWLQAEKELAVINCDRAALDALCATKDEADALEAKRKQLMRNQYEQRHGFHQIEHAMRSAGLA